MDGELEPDVIPGDGKKMVQVFPPGTQNDHRLKCCWCKPRYIFRRHEDGIYGIVAHH